MDILARKFWEKFTEIWKFRTNTEIGDSPYKLKITGLTT
jgi:hypothetical protein